MGQGAGGVYTQTHVSADAFGLAPFRVRFTDSREPSDMGAGNCTLVLSMDSILPIAQPAL